MNVYGKTKLKSCNYRTDTQNCLFIRVITKPQEKMSCKPTASQNLAGMLTLHLLKAARS